MGSTASTMAYEVFKMCTRPLPARRHRQRLPQALASNNRTGAGDIDDLNVVHELCGARQGTGLLKDFAAGTKPPSDMAEQFVDEGPSRFEFAGTSAQAYLGERVTPRPDQLPLKRRTQVSASRMKPAASTSSRTDACSIRCSYWASHVPVPTAAA